MTKHNRDDFMLREKYSFPLYRFIPKEKFERVKKFAEEKETPFLLVDLDVIKDDFDELTRCLPFSKIFYAVKANPMDEVLSLLRDLGSNFDVATRYEFDQLLKLGVDPSRISYGNTIKKEADIKYFYEKGVRYYATDSEQDLEKIARSAPGSNVFFRILTDGKGADWPLSKKFGAHPDIIYSLILKAPEIGLVPYGLSFHVGSQQRDIGQFDEAISKCTYLFQAAAEEGIFLKMINLGGGFPANYIQYNQSLDIYAKEIKRFLEDDFGDEIPEIWIEPGRSMAADSGIIVSEIIMISKKAKYSENQWVYIDIGKFGGMIETIDESIKYPIYCDREGNTQEVILAGPTCDSMDILYEDYKYKLPDTIQPGDKVYIFGTGAYTQSYSSIYFNGFPPLKAYTIK